MSTPAKMIEVARREIGVREGRDPNGNWNNRVKYNDWYVDVLKMGSGFRTSAWCAIFVSWVARHAGVPTSVIPNHAWTPSGDSFFRNKGLKVSTPKMGDIFYVYYPSMSRVAHVGIVESYSNGYITTIEGNTNSGQSRQGNGVYRLRRKVTSNIRVYRPRYGGSVSVPKTGVSWDGKSYPGRNVFRIGNKHAAIKLLGERLVKHGFGKHYQVGPGPTFSTADLKNVQDFQKAQGWSGSDADGYPGPESWRRLLAAPKAAAKPAAKKPASNKPTVSLSRVREAAQRDGKRVQGGTTPGAVESVKLVEDALKRLGYLNVKYAADGSFGTLTVSAYSRWQRWLGYRGKDADGIPGMTTLKKLGERFGFNVVD